MLSQWCTTQIKYTLQKDSVRKSEQSPNKRILSVRVRAQSRTAGVPVRIAEAIT